MPRDSRFSRIMRQAFRDCSTKTTWAAPRLRASIPMPPMPAQPSRKVVPSTLAPRMLNSVSLSLSLVGLIPGGGVALRRRLLYRPEIMRMFRSGHPKSLITDGQCPMTNEVEDSEIDGFLMLIFQSSISLVIGRSEEHTSELQSRRDLVCRLLLE